MMKKNILVTGGAGFIGSHIVDALVNAGHHVAVVDNLSTGNREQVNSHAVFYELDVTQPEIETVFEQERPDAVFHFAAHIEARKSVENPLNDARVNILGTLNVLEQCRKFKVKKVIFASSGGEIYGDATVIPTDETYVPDPISPYGVAKLAGEKYGVSYQKIHGIRFVALRLGNVYGPRQNPHGEAGVVAIFIAKMLQHEQPLIHGDGLQTKDYIFVDDVVQAALAGLSETVDGIFNVGTGKETSVIEIFEKLQTITQAAVVKKHTAFPAIGFGRGCLSITKAERELGFHPQVDINQGLELTVAWFKKAQHL